MNRLNCAVLVITLVLPPALVLLLMRPSLSAWLESTLALTLVAGAVEVAQESLGRIHATAESFASAAMVGLLIALSIGSKGAFSLPLTIVGLCLVVAGLTVRFVARRTLGCLFSHNLQIRAGHSIVTRGIYGCVRHPAYLGTLLFVAGLTFAFSSIVTAGVMLLLSPFGYRRIAKEEAMLTAYFGEPYKVYSRGTYCLLPLIW